MERGDVSNPEYWGKVAEEGEESDRQAWFGFLKLSQGLLKELGNVAFIHYSHYERTWVRKYIERWGDPDGVGTEILTLLWDIQAKAIKPAICFLCSRMG